jgi:hypothetical protein
LFWSDRDTILMNPHIPLSIFLPPKGFEYINMVVTRDRNGLNNGVFFVRVHTSSFKLFASALSIREYMPGLELKYTEQSGMEKVIETVHFPLSPFKSSSTDASKPWYNTSIAYVPQRWFNGFPPSSRPSSSASAHPGSLLIHFASNRDGLRPNRMAYWSEVAQRADKIWYKPINETDYPAEITEYWGRVGRGEDMKGICDDIGKRVWM